VIAVFISAVIARSAATKRSSARVSALDCFAALAMTNGINWIGKHAGAVDLKFLNEHAATGVGTSKSAALER
jgi:hypothetical protein